eukprot:3740167-Rhodomonas_salina.4
MYMPGHHQSRHHAEDGKNVQSPSEEAVRVTKEAVRVTAAGEAQLQKRLPLLVCEQRVLALRRCSG